MDMSHFVTKPFTLATLETQFKQQHRCSENTVGRGLYLQAKFTHHTSVS